MTLLTEHLEAGWREVESGEFGKWVAERVHARPGATSSVIRVEAPTSGSLQSAVSLRQSQLAGTEEPTKDTRTNDGSLVTGEQHEALRTNGVVVPGPEAQASYDEALAEKDKRIEDLQAEVAAANEALTNALTPAPEAVADPSQAPATEQTTEASVPSSAQTSEEVAPSPEQTSTDSPGTPSEQSSDTPSGASPASPAEGEQPPASE